MKKSRGENLDQLKILQNEMFYELKYGILPYWIDSVTDLENGGYIGQITGKEVKITEAERSCILNARLLWSFSAAYRVLKDEKYRYYAERSFQYLETYFHDKTWGGFYWSVDRNGKMINDKKHVYAHSFVIYGYSEYARATGSETALNRAFELFQLLEKHAADTENGGYNEAFSRNWKQLKDVRLSENDADEKRSMNTHLHIMEAYSNLYRAKKDSQLKERLKAIAELVLAKIYIDETQHFGTFFDQYWNIKSEIYSYGHDIEAAWLLIEAAEVLADPKLKFRAEQVAVIISSTFIQEGMDQKTGGVFNTGCNGKPHDKDFHWWVQAEAIVGLLYTYEITGNAVFLENSYRIWEFIKEYIKDPIHGEWYFRVDKKGVPDFQEDKVGPWKCPYHNSRMCLLVLERFNKDFTEVVGRDKSQINNSGR